MKKMPAFCLALPETQDGGKSRSIEVYFLSTSIQLFWMIILCLIIIKVPGESLQKIIFIVKKKKLFRYYNRILLHLKYFMSL